jgi:hypothetical protein
MLEGDIVCIRVWYYSEFEGIRDVNDIYVPGIPCDTDSNVCSNQDALWNLQL